MHRLIGSLNAQHLLDFPGHKAQVRLEGIEGLEAALAGADGALHAGVDAVDGPHNAEEAAEGAVLESLQAVAHPPTGVPHLALEAYGSSTAPAAGAHIDAGQALGLHPPPLVDAHPAAAGGGRAEDTGADVIQH